MGQIDTTLATVALCAVKMTFGKQGEIVLQGFLLYQISIIWINFLSLTAGEVGKPRQR